MALRTVRFVVTGRVQGVGFRWFTRTAATRLGIVGHVRNLVDGRVEVMGQGTAPELEALERKLATGPLASRVDNVEKVEMSSDISSFKSFEIN